MMLTTPYTISVAIGLFFSTVYGSSEMGDTVEAVNKHVMAGLDFGPRDPNMEYYEVVPVKTGDIQDEQPEDTDEDGCETEGEFVDVTPPKVNVYYLRGHPEMLEVHEPEPEIELHTPVLRPKPTEAPDYDAIRRDAVKLWHKPVAHFAFVPVEETTTPVPTTEEKRVVYKKSRFKADRLWKKEKQKIGQF